MSRQGAISFLGKRGTLLLVAGMAAWSIAGCERDEGGDAGSRGVAGEVGLEGKAEGSGDRGASGKPRTASDGVGAGALGAEGVGVWGGESRGPGVLVERPAAPCITEVLNDGGDVIVSWCADVPAGAWVEVERRVDPHGAFRRIGVEKDGMPCWLDVDASRGRVNCYRLRVRVGDSCSSYSETLGAVARARERPGDLEALLGLPEGMQVMENEGGASH